MNLIYCQTNENITNKQTNNIWLQLFCCNFKRNQ